MRRRFTSLLNVFASRPLSSAGGGRSASGGAVARTLRQNTGAEENASGSYQSDSVRAPDDAAGAKGGACMAGVAHRRMRGIARAWPVHQTAYCCGAAFAQRQKAGAVAVYSRARRGAVGAAIGVQGGAVAIYPRARRGAFQTRLPDRAHHVPVYSRARRGAVLLMVLGLILLTAFAVGRFLEIALQQMRAEATGTAELELRIAAHNALQLTLATLDELGSVPELDNGLYSPVQGWGDPLAYAGGVELSGNGAQVNIRVTDEGGRIGLNPPNYNELRLLLTQMEVAQWRSDELIDALIDWVDEDEDIRLNGAEDDYYISIGQSRLPSNAPLRSYDDFRYIKGWRELLFDNDGNPNLNYALLVGTTSLHLGGGSSVNINTMPSAVRYLFTEQMGMDGRKLVEHLAGSDRESGTEDDLFIRNQGELGLAGIMVTTGGGSGTAVAPVRAGFRAGLLRVEIEVSRGVSKMLLTVLLQPSATAGSVTAAGGGSSSGSGSGGTGGGGSGGSGGGGGRPGGGQGGSGSRAGRGTANASPVREVGTFRNFTLVEYAENMVIE